MSSIATTSSGSTIATVRMPFSLATGTAWGRLASVAGSSCNTSSRSDWPVRCRNSMPICWLSRWAICSWSTTPMSSSTRASRSPVARWISRARFSWSGVTRCSSRSSSPSCRRRRAGEASTIGSPSQRVLFDEDDAQQFVDGRHAFQHLEDTIIGQRLHPLDDRLITKLRCRGAFQDQFADRHAPRHDLIYAYDDYVAPTFAAITYATTVTPNL